VEDAVTSLPEAEVAYLDAREAADRLVVARKSGAPLPDVEEELGMARAALARIDPTGLGDEDRRAMTAMKTGLARVMQAASATDDTVSPLERAYTDATGRLEVGGEQVTRLSILGRLATTPDEDRRHELFLALSPLWRAVDGDGGEGSPYRALIERSAARWTAGESPITANATALGITPDTVTEWCEAILAAWHSRTAGDPPIEPWDWWWANGELERAARRWLPRERLREISDAYHAALGADVIRLGIVYDTDPRPERPPGAVSETEFGARPRRRPDGSWSTGRPTIFSSYVEGGLGELMELVHETGHGIHIAAIRTRPAYADWPDSDALTEAIADILAWDVPSRGWLRRWAGTGSLGVTETAALRATFAAVAMDAAWALLEIRLHADPARRAADAWAEIATGCLGIVPHTEWSWWAIRGQLVQEPGYMANYAIGSVLTAELRAAIRAARGDWRSGDPGWYGWVSERLFRFGLERPSRAVLRDLIGRAPTPDPLLAEIAGQAASNSSESTTTAADSSVR
jgi:hypothetical protein